MFRIHVYENDTMSMNTNNMRLHSRQRMTPNFRTWVWILSSFVRSSFKVIYRLISFIKCTCMVDTAQVFYLFSLDWKFLLPLLFSFSIFLFTEKKIQSLYIMHDLVLEEASHYFLTLSVVFAPGTVPNQWCQAPVISNNLSKDIVVSSHMPNK